MDKILMIYGLFAAGAAGLGIYLGVHITKLIRSISKTMQALTPHSKVPKGNSAEQETVPVRSNFGEQGKRRTSNCLALPQHGAIRHISGGYIRGFKVELQPTLLATEGKVESMYDGLAQMLAAQKPAGTILQFRFANHTDPGHVIGAHQESQGTADEVFAPAAALHNSALNFYEEMAARGHYRQPAQSLWVYVPTKHHNDNLRNGLSAFFRTLKRSFRLGGGVRSLMTAYQASNDGITRRLRADEEESFAAAEKVFRQLESSSPLKLTRLTYEETRLALYMGHNENAQSAPLFPTTEQADIRNLLCNETIEGNGWYLLHGSTPVAVVSLFAPPEPGAFAGILRSLTNNPALSGRHTLISEFITLDKRSSQKNLKTRSKRIVKSSVKAGGGVKLSAENQRAYQDIERVQMELTNAGEALIQNRFLILVYGPPAKTQEGLKESVKTLEQDCETIIATIRTSMAGADAAREEPEALRAIYHSTLIGEMEARKTGREIEEITDSLAALIPAETSWGGSPRAHSLVSTVGGRLIGLNFYQNKYSSSPLAIVIAQPGGGKSVFLARCATDILASLPHARVRVVDFGESLGPLVDLVGGRHLRFKLGEVRTINIWDYEGIEEGVMPDEEQITLVVEDLLKLSRTQDDEAGKIKESILKICVKSVYEDEVPHNQPGWPRHEPTHSHLLNKLANYPFKKSIQPHAESLVTLLEEYRHHAWLDAPTHEEYHADSPLDVYELDSLDRFPKDVRESLAFRVAARVIRTIGQKIEGELTPVLLIFDEMKKIKDNYPVIMTAIKKGARQGRKENVVTMLGTHSYDDLTDIRSITATAGIKIIGKQTGNYEELIKDAEWSATAAAAVAGIRNVKGSHAQYVISFGSGDDQQVEMVQVDLSSVELWTYTSDAIERNARARIARLMPHWNMAEIVMWLAAAYPRGLVFAGLTKIDEGLLPQEEIDILEEDEEQLWDEHHEELAAAAMATANQMPAELSNEGEARNAALEALNNFFGDEPEQDQEWRRPTEEEAAMINVPGIIIKKTSDEEQDTLVS